MWRRPLTTSRLVSALVWAAKLRFVASTSRLNNRVGRSNLETHCARQVPVFIISAASSPGRAIKPSWRRGITYIIQVAWRRYQLRNWALVVLANNGNNDGPDHCAARGDTTRGRRGATRELPASRVAVGRIWGGQK